MEAHEYIVQTVVEFALDIACVHILRYGVVDIQQGNCIVAYAGTDELRQSAIKYLLRRIPGIPLPVRRLFT